MQSPVNKKSFQAINECGYDIIAIKYLHLVKTIKITVIQITSDVGVIPDIFFYPS